VTVTDATGRLLGSGSGSGTAVDWTWDATSVAQDRYAWTIAAGDTVRAATGFVGARPVPLAVKSAQALPGTISPDGDGIADRATISYTLSTNATVTAVLRAPDGTPLATLFTGSRGPGKHTFQFTAEGVPDGRYQIEITATDGKTTVSATIAVTVDRTVATFAATPTVFSPNGDGRSDQITFTVKLVRDAQVRLDAKRGTRLVAPVFAGDVAGAAQPITWDGMTPRGRVADGTYAAVLTTTSSLGTTVHQLPFRVDTRPPVLRAISFRRLVFRISEPAQVRLVVAGRTYLRTVGAGVFSLRLPQFARRVSATATDAAGNVSRTIRFP